MKIKNGFLGCCTTWEGDLLLFLQVKHLSRYLQDLSNCRISDPFVRQFQELAMKRTSTMATRTVDPPTWGQIKKLTQEAEKNLQKANQPLNLVNLLLAMLTVINCQVSIVSAHSFAYWAYVPKPPLVRCFLGKI
ncbi:hypothetical protein H1C71_013795 [Ictidomys tridecemlineatus]|nr:hypothetical protein H1C71_013795 [Ictidomys tridecemlineatus]